MSEHNYESAEGMPFLGFILSLGTTALAAMGLCDDPDCLDFPRDPMIARYNIDILIMLREKTKGNLNEEEEKVLTSLIYDLQMRYLEQVHH